MKLILIGMILLAWPLVTWWMENRPEDEVIRMADRDRRKPAKPTRISKYTKIGKAPGMRAHPLGGKEKVRIQYTKQRRACQ